MKDPVLFIPALGCDARMFLPQIVHLGPTRAVQVALAVAADTVEKMAEMILAQAPPQFALVGHGLGGDVALEILRRDMERVTKLVLISTDPLSEVPPTAVAREARLVAAKSGRLAEAIAQEYPAQAFVESEWRDEILAVIRDMGLSLGETAFIRQSRAMQRRPDQQKTLRRAMLPVLIMAGREDSLVPTRRQDFAAALMPYARLEVIEASGHMPTLEQPQDVSDALEAFLDEPIPAITRPIALRPE